MFVHELRADNPVVRLVSPDIERDAVLGMEWLSGEMGRRTLELMGNNPEEITEPDLLTEKERIKDFLQTEDQIYWMIEVEDKVAGAIWVDLKQKGSVKAPSIHLMIGDPTTRGKGVGSAAFKTVMDWLITERRAQNIYTRHLKDNLPAQKLITNLGFKEDGQAYEDEDGLVWQNEVFSASTKS